MLAELAADAPECGAARIVAHDLDLGDLGAELAHGGTLQILADPGVERLQHPAVDQRGGLERHAAEAGEANGDRRAAQSFLDGGLVGELYVEAFDRRGTCGLGAVDLGLGPGVRYGGNG